MCGFWLVFIPVGALLSTGSLVLIVFLTVSFLKVFIANNLISFPEKNVSCLRYILFYPQYDFLIYSCLRGRNALPLFQE